MIDVLVTSVKPLNGDAYSERQLVCLSQMRRVARHVFLFNEQQDMAGYKSLPLIYPLQTPPQIQQMIEFATKVTSGTIGIVNSDIFLTDAIVDAVTIGNRLGRVWAATSFRWEGDRVEGQGLDVFLMSSRVAQEVAKVAPKFLTQGRAQWDNWMNGWLRKHLRSRNYFDMTGWKCVLHEPHERIPNRLSNYSDDQVQRLLHDVSCGGIPKQKYERGNGEG